MSMIHLLSRRLPVFILFLPVILQGQPAQSDFNIEFVGQLDYPELCSDIWGYVGGDGTEYAIMGVRNGTAIISLDDPANPAELAFIDQFPSIWRDYKSYGGFVFGIADQGTEGLLVVDMREAPDSVSWSYFRDLLTVRVGNGVSIDNLKQAHNIFVDENGILYLADARPLHRGIVMLDVSDPDGGISYVGAFNTQTAHDIYARDNLAFSSDIFAGHVSIWDISDKELPQLLATQQTSSTFTHNAWLSDDGLTLYTSDERFNAYIDAYDISDLGNIEFLDKYRPPATAGTGVIPHNVHVYDDYLVISYYTDGIKVVDASQPGMLTEVGSFDTFKRFGLGFSGCWGAYPFLPSGLILASDRQSGLYVLRPTYRRASFVQGTVTDAINGTRISNVEISIPVDVPQNISTNFNGEFRGGFAHSGPATLTFSHPSYLEVAINIDFVEGEIEDLEVEMTPRAALMITGTIRDDSGAPVPEAIVQADGDGKTFITTTNIDGTYRLPLIEAVYNLYAGKWGYETALISTDSLFLNTAIDGTLQAGYKDDFILDLGWTVEGIRQQGGSWERGIPIASYWDSNVLSNPGSDITGDVGNRCYVTGNTGGTAEQDDVDGESILVSPVMDLSKMTDPLLSFHSWLTIFGVSVPPDDAIAVLVDNGSEEVLVDRITNTATEWIRHEYRLTDYIELSDRMTVTFQVADSLGNTGHVVEAGLDGFSVADLVTSVKNLGETSAFVRFLPNPAVESDIQISYEIPPELGSLDLILYTVDQKAIHSAPLTGTGHLQPGWDLPAGMYFALLQSEQGRYSAMKVVIAR